MMELIEIFGEKGCLAAWLNGRLANMAHGVRCDWSYSETINFGMQQNHVPVVKRIVLSNPTEEELRGLVVELVSEPDFAYGWSKTIDVLPVGQDIDLGAIPVQMSTSFLAQLSERIAGSLTLTVRQGETELFRERGSISVLAFDEWSGLAVLPELVAAFVTPNRDSISQVIREAADIMGRWEGSPSFTAYQSKDPNQARIQSAAIYAALQAKPISYCVAPPSFESIGQRVRLPETIFAHLIGNCLDLSLLYAACLEAVGLHPLLVFTEGHAFAGVWLEPETFAESVQDDISVLTKRLAAGIHEICVVESTALTQSQPVSFCQAAMLAEGHLGDPDKFDCLVDVRRARAAAIRPLPLRTSKESDTGGESALPERPTDVANAPELLELVEKPIETDTPRPMTRQKQWERQLLDLTLRNSLLNLRLARSSIPVITAWLGDLEDELADGEEFQLLAKPSDWQDNERDAGLYQKIHANHPLAPLLREEFQQRRLRVDLNAADLERRIVHLYRSARSSLEENGANTLYLAFGLLRWYETTASEMPRYAPIVLLPVDIVRKSSRLGYVIRARDEEPQMNITLLEMLKQDFGIAIDGLDPLPRDDKGIALKRVFHVFRHALMHVSRWDVEETACVGQFSFGQFVMWNDIRTRAEQLAENKVVASLMEGKLKWQENSEEPSKPLDRDHPAALALPTSADSTQLMAIRAAADGQSFVLHGPPGTGKSQTITNMIANALAGGKKVLFVAEKMAALSVVQRRLEQIGLGPYCLELHSNKSTKKSVLDQLARVIESRKVSPPENWKTQADRLSQLRRELNGYAEALQNKHNSGMT
ncbi:MAG: putative helicase [Paenibacillaceae bacterium]|nr:putative helicase [Paenibacillaceae bacterium]